MLEFAVLHVSQAHFAIAAALIVVGGALRWSAGAAADALSTRAQNARSSKGG